MTKRTLEELEAARRAERKLLKALGEDCARKWRQELAIDPRGPDPVYLFPRLNYRTHLNQSASYLLVGKKGNEWSEQAEDILIEFQIPYRFQTISTPPHPNPLNCPGADPDVRAIPTLLLDYDTQDENGDSHHIRVPIATGIDEVKQWARAALGLRELQELREQEKTNDA